MRRVGLLVVIFLGVVWSLTALAATPTLYEIVVLTPDNVDGGTDSKIDLYISGVDRVWANFGQYATGDPFERNSEDKFSLNTSQSTGGSYYGDPGLSSCIKLTNTGTDAWAITAIVIRCISYPDAEHPNSPHVGPWQSFIVSSWLEDNATICVPRDPSIQNIEEDPCYYSLTITTLNQTGSGTDADITARLNVAPRVPACATPKPGGGFVFGGLTTRTWTYTLRVEDEVSGDTKPFERGDKDVFCFDDLPDAHDMDSITVRLRRDDSGDDEDWCVAQIGLRMYVRTDGGYQQYLWTWGSSKGVWINKKDTWFDFKLTGGSATSVTSCPCYIPPVI